MVSGVITASDFSNFEPKLIDEARFTLVAKVLFPQLFQKKRLTPNMGRTYNAPKHGTVTATALVEGVPLAIGQVPVQGNTAITPGEAGVAIVLTDVALSAGRDDYAAQMGRVMGDSIGQKVDKDGVTRFQDYTAIGTAGSAMTVGFVNAAVARVAAGNAAGEPPTKPWWFVSRPEPMRILLNAIVSTGTYPVPSGISQEVIEQYYAHDMKVFGLNGGFATINAPRNASGANDSTSAVFAQDSEIFVEAHPVQFEKERSIALRGWLMTGIARYAYGAYQTGWGTSILTDSALPSS